MKQNDFESKNNRIWHDFERLLDLKNKDADKRRLPELYQQTSHHLAIAKQRRYSANLIQQLNRLVVLGHERIYGDAPQYKTRFLYFIFFGFPITLRENIRYFWWALAFFLLPGLAAFFICLFSDDLIYSLMDYHTVRNLESMYEPGTEALGRERQSDTDLMMFGFYIYNNIGISFQTFAGGVLFGLGTLFYLVFNGLFMGAAAGHIAKVGYYDTFFPFVIGHGAFELTAIVFAGTAGLMLGWSLISPGNYSRLTALKIAAKKAVMIIYGSTLMLVIAAFLEAFWSSSSTLPIAVKYSVGAFFWLIVALYFIFAGRKQHAIK